MAFTCEDASEEAVGFPVGIDAIERRIQVEAIILDDRHRLRCRRSQRDRDVETTSNESNVLRVQSDVVNVVVLVVLVVLVVGRPADEKDWRVLRSPSESKVELAAPALAAGPQRAHTHTHTGATFVHFTTDPVSWQQQRRRRRRRRRRLLRALRAAA